MSEIQRYFSSAEMCLNSSGNFVLYDDHIAALSRYRWLSANEVSDFSEPQIWVCACHGSESDSENGTWAGVFASRDDLLIEAHGCPQTRFYRVPEDGGAK